MTELIVERARRSIPALQPAEARRIFGIGSMVTAIDPGLAATALRFADKLLHVKFAHRPPVLYHVEFQARADREMPERMAEYLALVIKALGSSALRNSRLECAVIYLDREAYREDPGVLELKGHRKFRLRFEYEVIRLWEQDPGPILRMRSPGLCPFVPLMRGNPEELVLKSSARIRDAPESLAGPEAKSELLGVLAGLAGSVMGDRRLLDRLISEIDVMRKNYVFEVLMKRGEARGLVKGMKRGIKVGMREGVLAAAVEGILRILKRRFGKVPVEVSERLKAIDDPEFLQRLIAEAAVCSNPDDFARRLKGGG